LFLSSGWNELRVYTCATELVHRLCQLEISFYFMALCRSHKNSTNHAAPGWNVPVSAAHRFGARNRAVIA